MSFGDLPFVGETKRPNSGRGRKRTVNTSRSRKAIGKRVQRNPRVSMRQIARDRGIRDRSVKGIAKTELGLKPYKLRKVQLLAVKNKLVRLRRCRKLLRRAASQRWERFIFDDVELFTVHKIHKNSFPKR
ncbi:uncharacterized protein TNCV_3264281 [Trichonephila clavipes]|nr:uncharacterized protein TNCV_3264281 [Trichonephila clavipes]